LNAALPAGVVPGSGEVPAATAPCLIVNPRSFRAARGLAARAAALALAQGADVVEAETPAALHAACERILRRRQRRVIVLAGDGSVCALVDHLAAQPAGAWLPELLLLPGGRTNLIAADLRPARDALAMLAQALGPAAERQWDAALVERSALCVEQEGAPPRHGFFVAGAALDQIIRQVHRFREAPGSWRQGDFGFVRHLAGLAAAALVGRSGIVCPALAVDAGEGRTLAGPTRLLLVTTLRHEHGAFDPYAERGAGELRVTSIARDASRFWRSLPRVLTGSYTAAMDTAHGYLSGRCGRIEVRGIDAYTLDGEEHAADPTLPLVIRAGPKLRFVGHRGFGASGRPEPATTAPGAVVAGPSR
jgi:hypothetical protein